MRIALVAHSRSGWTPRFCRSFLERGDEVLVVSFSPEPVPDVEVPMEFVGVEPFDHQGNKWMFLTRVPRVRRILRRYAPDIVLAPYLSSNGLTAALAWPGPTVVCAVGSDVLSPHITRQPFRWLRELSIRLVLRRSAGVNAVSKQLADELSRLGGHPERILMLPFGADLDGFGPPADAPRTEALRLICTRRHQGIYDIPTVIRGLARLRDLGVPFHCTFTCGGTLLEDHRRLAVDLELKSMTEFTGDLPTGALPGILRSCDIYISASHTDGTSVALLEAMATGLLPVVSDIPANRAWITDAENGLLFRKGDPDGLAAALQRAISDRPLRNRAFDANRRSVQESGDWNRNVGRLADWMETIVSGHQGRGAVARPQQTG